MKPETSISSSPPIKLLQFEWRFGFPQAMDPAGAPASGADATLPLTTLLYFDHMWQLQATAAVVSIITEGERVVVVLNWTILYPQGGDQPFDIGSIEVVNGTIKFYVTNVRAKSAMVYHYGNYDESIGTEAAGFQPRDDVKIALDGTRRTLNSRLHSASHFLGACMSNIGLESLERGKIIISYLPGKTNAGRLHSLFDNFKASAYTIFLLMPIPSTSCLLACKTYDLVSSWSGLWDKRKKIYHSVPIQFVFDNQTVPQKD